MGRVVQDGIAEEGRELSYSVQYSEVKYITTPSVSFNHLSSGHHPRLHLRPQERSIGRK